MTSCKKKITFDYETAFSRNLGWVNPSEQQKLRECKIAIAGMGGVGGAHLLTLSRLGIGHFHIADFDSFEVHNFNRQVGATISHLGQPKCNTMAEMCLDINPEMEVVEFEDGINEENLDAFLDGVDLYVDSLDFFAVDIRRKVFARCDELKIPAITVAPLGMGAGLLCFMPGKMNFEEYFQLEGHDREEQLYRFLVGLAPKAGHRNYLVDASYVDLRGGKGPSTGMAIQMCSSLAGTTALKILLGRGKIKSAPWGLQIDGYTQSIKKSWRPGGNRNPLQQLLLKIVRKQLGRQALNNIQSTDEKNTAIERILDQARWSPSGDNTQPWRFEILSDTQVRVIGNDTRTYCVYDLEGHASQVALGAMLETLRIAATKEGFKTEIVLSDEGTDDAPIYEIELIEDKFIKTNKLHAVIPERCTQRRLMKTKELTADDKRALEEAVQGEYRIVWTDGFVNKLKMAGFLFKSAKIRLTTKEAYDTHADVIDWNKQFSTDAVPDQAIGLSNISLKFCKWAMQSWERVKFANRYLGGTVLPRVELDFLPAMFCGAHFYLIANEKPETTEDFTRAGMAVQRLWLTATKLGLQFQPEMTPLIFAGYARDDLYFTEDEGANNTAISLNAGLKKSLGPESAAKLVFMGRMGYGKAPKSRSIRMRLDDLVIQDLRTDECQHAKNTTIETKQAA